MLLECGEKETPLYTVGGNIKIKPLWKKVQKFLNKLKINVPYDPTIGYISEESEKSSQKRLMPLRVHSKIIFSNKD